MSANAALMTTHEVEQALQVTQRQVRRLADAGHLHLIARGVYDAASVESYRQSHRSGRTRAWAEHTAWGAVALLENTEATWVGASQTSRLRRALREMNSVDELLARMRDRAHTTYYEAHRAAIPHLRESLVTPDLTQLGIVDLDDRVDGYASAAQINHLVADYGLRASTSGTVTLRATADIERVRDLIGTRTVAALDGATGTDARVRGVCRAYLAERLEAFT